MNIGITYDLKEDWVPGEGEPKDINAEFDDAKTLQEIVSALESGGHVVKKIGNVKTLLSQMDDLDVDIVFNICEGVKGRNRESQVPVLLEMKDVPFVGADGLCLGMTLDKIVAKKMFISEGIPTAGFFAVSRADGVEEQLAKSSLQFPLIVKTRHEGTSKGITKNSRVEDMEALKQQVDIINKQYHQAALVEEFIAGTEFTVPVMGNGQCRAMPVIQVSIDGRVDLGDDFYSHEMVSYNGLRYVCPAQAPEGLLKKMQDLAVKVYKCVECRDMGRVDFRVDEKGNPYVLEINPLPSLSKEDVFNIFPETLGSNYDETINQILNFALKRYNMIDYCPEYPNKGIQ